MMLICQFIRLLILSWVLTFGHFVSVSSVYGFQKIPKFKPVDSTLKKFGAALSKNPDRTKLFKITNMSGKLVVDYAKGGNDARGVLMNVARKVSGASGSSSSSSGGDMWSMSMNGSSLNVRAGHGRQYWNPSQEMVFTGDANSFYLVFREVKSPHTSVFVSAESDKAFRVDLTDDSGTQIFRFRQYRSGKVEVLEVSPEFQFREQADNFEEFAANNPEYLSERLLPIFVHCGIGEPPSRFHNFVRDTVLFKLEAPDPAKKAQFDELVAQMDDKKFEARESATKNLTNKFKEWESFIQTAQKDPQYSVEVRARLRKMYDSKTDAFRRGMMGIVNKYNLEKDPDYLVWLLRGKDSLKPEKIQAIVNRLKSLTEQTFDRPEQWIAWSAKQKKQRNRPTMNNGWEEVLKSSGILDGKSEEMSQLIHFMSNDETLEIDQGHWQRCMGGKTVKELKAEVQAYLKERNLPNNWFKPGGDGNYPEQTVEFPQIIFERLIDGQEPEQNYANMLRSYSRYVLNTGNREFLGKKMFAQLKVHHFDRRRVFVTNRNANRPAVVPDRLMLEIGELSDAKRKLTVSDDRQGNVTLAIEFPMQNSMVQLVQRAKKDSNGNRCFLIQAVGQDLGVLSDVSFDQLVRRLKSDEPEKWKKFVQLFGKFGISLELESK